MYKNLLLYHFKIVKLWGLVLNFINLFLSVILLLDVLLNLNNLLSSHLKFCNINSLLVFTDVRPKSPKVFLLFVKLRFKEL
jgi:hypothetical protein